MKKLLAATALCALPFGALAADLPVRAPAPAPVYVAPVATWTGLYVGAHVGYAWGDADVTRSQLEGKGPDPWKFGKDVDGAFGGLQLGYDIQFNSFVLGVVADLAVANISCDGYKPSDFAGPPAGFRTTYDWLSTVRARAGFLVTPAALFYVHGGLAMAKIGVDGIGGKGPWADVTGNDTQTGWVLGAGIEYKMTQNVSLFAEYSYMDFGSQSIVPSDGPPSRFAFDNTVNTVKFGVNYRFNSGAAAPVMARY